MSSFLNFLNIVCDIIVQQNVASIQSSVDLTSKFLEFFNTDNTGCISQKKSIN